MKKIFVFIAALVLSVALSTEALAGIESISLSNNERETVPEYKVSYRVDGDSLSPGENDYISIYFPGVAELPTAIEAEDIIVNSVPAREVRTFKEQKRVDVLVTNEIKANQLIEVIVKPGVGIKNPVKTGTYYLEMSTSKTSVLTRVKYEIIPTAISSPEVVVSPGVTEAAAEYNISFRISHRGGLVGGTDTISIEFPQEAVLPFSISKNEITVNGKILDTGDLIINGSRLTFTVPSNITVEQNGQVNLLIKSGANIKNPGKPGEYNLRVLTSRDGAAVSNLYTISESAVTDLVVDVEPNLALAETSYSISFQTSPYGALIGGKDKITIVFRNGVDLPASISPRKFEVQGKLADVGTLKVDSHSISYNLPANSHIGPQSQVNINILPGSGIKNPSRPSAYDIELNTSSDQNTVTSNSYTIIAEKKKVILPINSMTAYVDGRPVYLDAPARVLNGRTLVPVRFAAESLGAQVNWNDKTKEVDISLNGKNIKLRIDSKLATVDNKLVTLDTAPIILEDRTMVPIRFIAENLETEVRWDDKTQTVTLN